MEGVKDASQLYEVERRVTHAAAAGLPHQPAADLAEAERVLALPQQSALHLLRAPGQHPRFLAQLEGGRAARNGASCHDAVKR